MSMNLDAVFRIVAQVKDEGLGKLGQTVQDLEKTADGAKKSFKGMIDSSLWQGAAVAAAGLTAGIVLATKSAIDFESSMTEVKKVVDGLETPKAIAEIQQEIFDLASTMPLAVDGFAKIYAAAGEAGIPKAQIREFAVDVAKMAVAFDMTAEEAGDAMAKLRTSLGMSQPEVRLLGDAMNHLSNNMASSAKQVTDFMLRSGAMGVQAGFTAVQTAAIGSAMIAAGAQSEVAATSFNNMVRALTRGDSMTVRQASALATLGLASRDAAIEEKRLTDAVERESERRLEAARRETDGVLKEINRRYRDQLTQLKDQWDDESDAFQDALDKQADAQIRGLKAREDAEIDAIRKAAETSKASTSAAEAAVRERYALQIDAIHDRAKEETKVEQRAARDRQQVVMDSLDDRKDTELKAAEDRYKEIAKMEKRNLEEAKIRAKMAATEISASAGAELAKRMQVDAVGTMMDIFNRIKALPKELQVSVISDLFGDEARAIPLLLNNMDNLKMALQLVGDQQNYAGSTAGEFAKKIQDTASQLQIAQNKLTILAITLAQKGGLLDMVLAVADAFGKLSTGIIAISDKFPGLTPLITGLTLAFIALVAVAPFLVSFITLWGTFTTAIAATNLGVILAGWASVAAVALAGIQTAFMGLLGWLTSTLLPGLLAFFSGPAGWTVLAVAAVVAMVVLFRKPLEDFVAWLWDWGEPIRRFWGNLWNSAGDTAREAFTALPGVFDQYITRPFLQIGPTLQTNWKALWDSLTGIAAAGWKAFSDGNQKNLVEPFLASRDKIAKGWEELAPKIALALAGIGDLFRAKVTTPIQEAWQGAVAFMQGVITKAQAAFAAAWNAIAGGIQGAFRGMLQTIANIINGIIGALNSLIDGINSVRAAVNLGPIGKLGYVSAPAFAEGGVVSRPTLAMVGEGGEREYIIPESKMARAVSNYLAGERGASVLTSRTYQPAAAVGVRQGGAGAPQRSTINITTGPVQQIEGKRYATLADLESVAQQVATQIYGTLRTPAGRRAIGVA